MFEIRRKSEDKSFVNLGVSDHPISSFNYILRRKCVFFFSLHQSDSILFLPYQAKQEIRWSSFLCSVSPLCPPLLKRGGCREILSFFAPCRRCLTLCCMDSVHCIGHLQKKMVEILSFVKRFQVYYYIHLKSSKSPWYEIGTAVYHAGSTNFRKKMTKLLESKLSISCMHGVHCPHPFLSITMHVHYIWETEPLQEFAHFVTPSWRWSVTKNISLWI